MVKNFIACAFAAFFMASFLACSSNPPPKQEKVSLTAAILPEWKRETTGFFPHKDHKYGFDRHPDKNKDSIVYASVLRGDNGFVTIYIHPFYTFFQVLDYYICDPDSPYPYTSIQDIDDSESRQTYAFTAKDEVKKLGLCFKSKRRTRIAQTLEIHPYDWKEYDFEAYIFGDKNKNDDRNQLIHRDEFWNTFDTVFAQAVVRHNGKNLKKEHIHDDRGYILSRAWGNYKDKGRIRDTCVAGDVMRKVNDIQENSGYNNKRRAIIQVGYPVKKFWPLSANINDTNNIKICGHPGDAIPRKLELERISNSGVCKDVIVPKAFAISGPGDFWTLEYENGDKKTANLNNIDTACVVFVEAKTSNKVEEIGDEHYGKVHGVMMPNYYANVAVVAWLNNSKAIQSGVSLHELGHTMGLYDLNDEPVSYNAENSIENNLMYWGPQEKGGGYKLRKRGIKTVEIPEYGNTIRIDYQWDCLQQINMYENCAHQRLNLELR